MLPGVCTWCGCAVRAPKEAPSLRCHSCRHWLLADLDAGNAAGVWTYVVVPFAAEHREDGLRLVPRGGRTRFWLPHALMLGWLLGGHGKGHGVYPTLGVLLGAWVALSWLFDRPRVLVSPAGIRMRGGWRFPRRVPAVDVSDLRVETFSYGDALVVEARGVKPFDLAVVPVGDPARVLLAHVRRALHGGAEPAAIPA